jgi:acetyl-CoA carboxylase carboxyltransferase component
MGGPAMIEGGGLGVYRPEEVGPIDMQSKNGVVDVRVADEAAAVAVAKQYLGYFQGVPITGWTCGDQAALRTLVPPVIERRRAFKIRPIIDALADTGSVLELRREFGTAMVTALARIEGQPVGVIANSSQTLGGAIDSDASDKCARFLQLCDAFGLPVISLCDTPGFMVGPKAEATALVRHASRLFAVAASLRVPMFSVILRRGYGLGAQAMTAGHFHASAFTIAWPTGEFGAMGIEGAVRLGMKKQLDAIPDPVAREAAVQVAVAAATERGKAISMASYLEIDGVIDPADTRTWLARGLRTIACTPDGAIAPPRERRWIDTW